MQKPLSQIQRSTLSPLQQTLNSHSFGGFGLSIDVAHDLAGVGRNLRDHPMAMALYEYQGELEDDTEAMLQTLLRYTTEGSTTRDDMHLGILLLDPAHVPAGLPLGIAGNCIAIFASVQNALSAGELRLRSSNPDDPPVMDFRYMGDPWDLQRTREGVRLVSLFRNIRTGCSQSLGHPECHDFDLYQFAVGWSITSLVSGFRTLVNHPLPALRRSGHDAESGAPGSSGPR